MKQLIVLLASIMLGLCLVSFLIGDGDSILNSVTGLWQREYEIRSMQQVNE